MISNATSAISRVPVDAEAQAGDLLDPTSRQVTLLGMHGELLGVRLGLLSLSAGTTATCGWHERRAGMEC